MQLPSADNYKDLLSYQNELGKDRDSYGYASDQVIAGIQGDASKYVADAYAGAQMYGADANIEIAGIEFVEDNNYKFFVVFSFNTHTKTMM